MPRLLSAVRHLVNNPLQSIGFEIRRKVETAANHSMPNLAERLAHARSLGFEPRTVFDGGAFVGSWTLAVSGLFPLAQFVVVEPNPFLQEALRAKLNAIQPSPVIVEAALGFNSGTASFNIWGDPSMDMSASLLRNAQGPADTVVTVNVETLDRLAERHGRMPDLLKLDLQGAEVPALKGAPRCLEHAEMVIAEFGCLTAYEGRTTPRELLDLLYDAGFVLYDIVDSLYRPFDGALAGGDFFFVKASSPLRRHRLWK
jgi:FkbM family methyltransferase